MISYAKQKIKWKAKNKRNFEISNLRNKFDRKIMDQKPIP